MIEINDHKNLVSWDRKAIHSTLYCRKHYPYVCKRLVDFRIDPYGYVYILWWKMKIIESRYIFWGTNAFTMFTLVVALSGHSIGVHLEVELSFSTRDLQLSTFSRIMSGCGKSLFNIKSYTLKIPMGYIHLPHIQR